MNRFRVGAASLWHQTAAEVRLFCRSRQAMVLQFFLPMAGMALFVYLHREGMLGRVFALLGRGLGARGALLDQVSPIILVTTGIVTYCIIASAFEGLVPRVVRERDAGLLKRLGGTPLRRWVPPIGKAINASLLVFVEATLVLVVGSAATDVTVVGSWLLLALAVFLGTMTMASLGFLVSNLTSSPDGAVVAVHVIYIPMLLLCGAFIPVEALPGALRVLAKVLPLTYFAAPFRSIVVEGAGLIAVGPDLLILCAWMVSGWTAAILTFRWE